MKNFQSMNVKVSQSVSIISYWARSGLQTSHDHKVCPRDKLRFKVSVKKRFFLYPLIVKTSGVCSYTAAQ